ncbi:MAG: hypothetical protein RL660_882 [Bacteroidota bacterium]|jgi:gliding motility-associated-like protein
MRGVYLPSLLVLLLLCHRSASGQPNIVEGSLLKASCTVPCKMLHATFDKPQLTNQYTLDSGAYAPLAHVNGTSLVIGDDSFSNVVPIGFTFCFYGQSYNNCVISTNGVISFSTGFANSFCSFNTSNPLPYSSATFPANSICGPYTDMDFKSNSVLKYETIGTSPNRKFLVSYNNMRLFSTQCSNAECTFQVILHETSNIIESHILKKDTCTAAGTSSPINYATLGIQNANATQMLVAPFRNASIWSLNNKSYKFLPSGGPAYTIVWTRNGSPIIANPPDSAYVCLDMLLDTNRVVLSYSQTCPSLTRRDTLIFWQEWPVPAASTIVMPDCVNPTSGSITQMSTSNYGPLQYSLSGGAWSSNFTYSGLTQGVYSVMAKDTFGCIDTTVFQLQNSSTIGISLDSLVLTNCDTSIHSGYLRVAATGGTAPYTYVWNTGATTSGIGNLAIGNYTVTVTDAVGCTKSAVYYLDKESLIVEDSIAEPPCGGLGGLIWLDVIGGTPSYAFSWSNGDTLNYIDSLSVGITYFCTISDAVGCTKQYAFTTSTDSSLAIYANIIKPTCDMSNGIVTVTVTNSSLTPFTYLWSGGSTNDSLLGVDSNLYWVTVTDMSGCSGTLNFAVDDTLDFDLYTASTAPKCGVANGSIITSVANTMGPHVYAWSTGASTDTIGNLAGGSYTLTVTDANGCMETRVITVPPSPAPNISLFTINAHCDTVLGSITSTTSGLTSPIQYTWNTGATTSSLTQLQPGFYSVLAIDVNGCSSSTYVNLADVGTPYLQVVDFVPPLCAGDSTGLVTLAGIQGFGPYKYSTDGINYDVGATLTNFAAGTYTIYIIDQYGCVNDTTLFFDPDSKPIFTHPPVDTLLCFDDRFDLPVVASGGVSPYKYIVNNVLIGNVNVIPNLGRGLQQIILVDSLGCMYVETIDVIAPQEALNISFAGDDVPCFETNTGSIIATANGGWGNYTYSWAHDTSTSAILANLTAGTYTLSVRDGRGCVASFLNEVFQETCCEYSLPNAFTPNADATNDDINALGLGNLESYELFIYSRWGQLLYKTTNSTDAWDGTYNGKALEPDTYFYLMRYKCIEDKNVHISKGEFLLMK